MEQLNKVYVSQAVKSKTAAGRGGGGLELESKELTFVTMYVYWGDYKVSIAETSCLLGISKV